MLVNELKRICPILTKVTNQNSITALYKSVELNSDAIRVCSEYGNIEFFFGLPNLQKKMLVSVPAFIGVIASLPEQSEIVFKQVDNSIQWTCGTAKGQWLSVPSDNFAPLISHHGFPWRPAPTLISDAIILATSACEATTVAVGLYGVEVQKDGDQVRFTSCNGVSLASALTPLYGFQDIKIVMRPPVPQILSSLLKTTTNSGIDVCSEGIFFLADQLAAHLPISPELEQDLTKVREAFFTQDHKVEVDPKAIKNFLYRAKSMADKGTVVSVGLSIDSGRLVLEHNSMAASSEEYFLANGIDPTLKFNSVLLSVDLVSTSIEHIKGVVLDYLDKNALMLYGEDPEFIHIIGGQNKQ